MVLSPRSRRYLQSLRVLGAVCVVIVVVTIWTRPGVENWWWVALLFFGIGGAGAFATIWLKVDDDRRRGG